jgi:hypothetical protein
MKLAFGGASCAATKGSEELACLGEATHAGKRMSKAGDDVHVSPSELVGPSKPGQGTPRLVQRHVQEVTQVVCVEWILGCGLDRALVRGSCKTVVAKERLREAKDGPSTIVVRVADEDLPGV